MNNSKSKTRVCAVIPFHNEERFIRKVVTDALNYVDYIFAVDDGSDDNSAEQIRDFPNVRIIRLERNYGKGFALQRGFEECLKEDFDSIVTLDGDNQHEPEFIIDFINASDEYDIVIGNRLNDTRNMPVLRILSNRITSMLLSVKTGQKIPDSQCGFRLYKRAVLENINTVSDGFEAESEILILASGSGYRIGSADISTVYGSEKSKMMALKAITGFIRILFSNGKKK